MSMYGFSIRFRSTQLAAPVTTIEPVVVPSLPQYMYVNTTFNRGVDRQIRCTSKPVPA